METQAGTFAHEPEVAVEVAVAEVLVDVDEGAEVVVGVVEVVVGVVVVAVELVVVDAGVEVVEGVETVDGLEVVPPLPLWRIAFLIAWSKRPFAVTREIMCQFQVSMHM